MALMDLLILVTASLGFLFVGNLMGYLLFPVLLYPKSARMLRKAKKKGVPAFFIGFASRTARILLPEFKGGTRYGDELHEWDVVGGRPLLMDGVPVVPGVTQWGGMVELGLVHVTQSVAAVLDEAGLHDFDPNMLVPIAELQGLLQAQERDGKAGNGHAPEEGAKVEEVKLKSGRILYLLDARSGDMVKMAAEAFVPASGLVDLHKFTEFMAYNTPATALREHAVLMEHIQREEWKKSKDWMKAFMIIFFGAMVTLIIFAIANTGLGGAVKGAIGSVAGGGSISGP